MKNCILQKKKTFLFLSDHELDIVLEVNRDRKNRVRKVCLPKIFFDLLAPVKVRNFGNSVIYCLLALLEMMHLRQNKTKPATVINGYTLADNLPAVSNILYISYCVYLL